jgi:hypothetical protein
MRQPCASSQDMALDGTIDHARLDQGTASPPADDSTQMTATLEMGGALEEAELQLESARIEIAELKRAAGETHNRQADLLRQHADLCSEVRPCAAKTLTLHATCTGHAVLCSRHD